MRKFFVLCVLACICLVSVSTKSLAVEYHALLVGIEHWQHLRPRSYCVDDIYDMRNALKNNFLEWKLAYQSGNIEILTNSQATKDNIESKLETVQGLDQDDVFLFHYSGHGDKDDYEAYICPYDANPSNHTNEISDHEFVDWMNNIPAKKIIIIDACHSGGMIGPGRSKGVSDLPVDSIPESGGFQTVLSSLNRGVALLGCKRTQWVAEFDMLHNGLFSYYLVEALNKQVDDDSDNYTSAEEIWDYASPKVDSFSRSVPPSEYVQQPVIKDKYSGKLGIGVVSPAAPTGLHAWCEFAAFPGFVEIHLAWDPNSESDLERYNVYHQPDGGDWGLLKTTTDTTASHIVRYETVHYYYVTALDFAENESDGSDTIEVVAKPEASPFVFTWDGTEFVMDNSILPASEIISGVNTDYYKIETHLEEQNNEYLLQIIESGSHHTYLDQMKLLAVDHPENEELSIGTTPDGEIIAYEETASPISCEDNYGNGWLDSVKTVGDGYYSSEDGDWLDLDFGEVDEEEQVIMVGTWMAAKSALHVQIQEDDEWEDVGIIYPRAMYSTTLVNLSEFDFNGKVRIYCEGNAVIDYVALAESEMEDVKIRECPLKTAIHSEEGSVKQELLNIDEDYAEIMPGDTINLAFNGYCQK